MSDGKRTLCTLDMHKHGVHVVRSDEHFRHFIQLGRRRTSLLRVKGCAGASGAGGAAPHSIGAPHPMPVRRHAAIRSLCRVRLLRSACMPSQERTRRADSVARLTVQDLTCSAMLGSVLGGDHLDHLFFHWPTARELGERAPAAVRLAAHLLASHPPGPPVTATAGWASALAARLARGTD